MKKILSILFLLFAVNVMGQKSIPRPNPPRLVNDNAKLLDPHDAELLERKLRALDDSSSNQIAILTLPSLNGEIIEDVAVETFRAWGIGNKKTNNGILVIIALAERKIRIEVGYGLEGAIPDITAKQIIKNDISPAFKEGNYLSGINKAVDDLSKAAVGEYKVKQEKKGTGSGSGGKSILGLLIILVIIFVVIGGRGGGSNGRRGGGNLIAPLLLANLLSGGGRSSGGWGGGGDSGGGSSWGGFGGGSSGGGGASGDW
jgi:uncharacterized protein